MPVSPAMIVLGRRRFITTLRCVANASSAVKMDLKNSSIGMLYLPTIKAMMNTIPKQSNEMAKKIAVFLFISIVAHLLDLDPKAYKRLVHR